MALIELVIVVAIFAAWIQGLVLSFKANPVLGIICIFIPIAGVVVGAAKWITGENLAKHVADKGMFGD